MQIGAAEVQSEQVQSKQVQIGRCRATGAEKQVQMGADAEQQVQSRCKGV